MADSEWFDQDRYELNGLSTKAYIKHNADIIDAARHMDRSPTNEVQNGNLGRYIADARISVDALFGDPPSAVVLRAAGLDQPTMERAIDQGRFDVVLRDLEKAVQIGQTSALPQAAALARAGADTDAHVDANLSREPVKPDGLPAESVQAAERALRAADNSLIETIKARGPRADVAAGVERVSASAEQVYWASAVAAGHDIIAKQATQKQAAQLAGQSAETSITRAQKGD